MSEQTLQAQVRRARGKFAAMAATYSLGVFNDNFFKQAACLLAVMAGKPDFQGYAAAVFTLPWLLFSSHAGWMADRFPKRSVVIAAKALELVAMIAGGLGVVLVSWPLIFVMLFLMALQSTIFSPALNGSIPELYPQARVMRANSTLKTVTTSAILIGIILAGLALSQKWASVWGVPLGRAIVGGGVVAVAAAGLAISLGVPRRPPADPGARFPWRGPVDTLRELFRIRTDRLLAIAIVADAMVWFIAVVQILLVNEMGIRQFGLGEQATSFLVVAELGGVAVGGLLARRLAKGLRWLRFQVAGFTLLGLPMVAMAGIPYLPAGWRVAAAAVLLLAAGVPGGLLLVPLESFFQTRPAPERRGTVIAAANFAGFFAMALAGLASNPLNLWVTPTRSFAVVGALSLAAAVGMLAILRKGLRS